MKLPPMKALPAFEAVARLGSVSKAADELCVSQGAISQQVRNLEDHLGRELFERTPNSIALSDEGEVFAGVVQSALGDIAEAAERITTASSRSDLTVSMGQGIAIRWVMPNLGDFYRQHPDINVIIDQSVRLVSFKNDGIDAAIRFCNGEFDDLDSALLFHPRMYAAASPDYLEQYGELESLARPDGHRLIDHQYRSREIRSQHVHWEDVCADGRIDPQTEVLIFPDELQSSAAAVQGRGIALVADYLAYDEFESGRLRLACAESVPALFSYYLVWPADARPNPARDAFRDWLVQRFEKFRRS